MPKVSRSVLYSFFPKGGKPTSGQFKTFIDSVFNFSDDQGLLGLNNYDDTLSYNTGDTVVDNKIIYQANKVTTPGPRNPADWDWIAGGTSGSLVFKGPWDAQNDIPSLASPKPVPPAGEFYVVIKAGDTNLSGITDWQIGDWAISAGTQWFKVDNSDLITGAQNSGSGAGVFNGKNGTTLLFRTLTNLDGSVNISVDNSTINLSVDFDDAGTSPTRTWSAFKISGDLSTKEPAITGTGNTGDYWSGTKTFLSLQDGVLGSLLNGLSLATNQVISATDTVIQAFGYLQKQLIDLTSTVTSHIGNTSNPHNVTKAQVGLPDVPNLKENLSATVDPTASDDNTRGYAIGSTWINTSSGKSFICLNAGTRVALWKETTNFTPTVFGNDYLVVESFVPVSTNVAKPSFADYTTATGTLKLSTGTRNGTYRLQWSCLIQTNAKAGQFQIKNITSSTPQVTALIDIQTQNTSDVVPVGWAGNVDLNGTNQDFVVQFNTALAGQPVTIKQVRMEIYRIV